MSTYESHEPTNRIDALSSVAGLTLEEEKPSRIKQVFPPLILGVFFVALLMALISGVLAYQYISNTQAQSNTTREGVGLICNAVRANDADNTIAAGVGPEGRSLVIVEALDSGTYETRYYLSQGKVLQEYSLSGSPYTPEKANEVIESNTFSFSYSDGLLSITTDQGTSEIALRSMEGGE